MVEWLVSIAMRWAGLRRRQQVTIIIGALIVLAALLGGAYLLWDVVAAVFASVAFLLIVVMGWLIRPIVEQFVAHELQRRRSRDSISHDRIVENRANIEQAVAQIEAVDREGREVLNHYRHQPVGLAMLTDYAFEMSGDGRESAEFDAARGRVRGAIDVLAGLVGRIRDDDLRHELTALCSEMETLYLGAYPRDRIHARRAIDPASTAYGARRDAVRTHLTDRWRELE